MSALLVGCAAAPLSVGSEDTGCDEQPASFEEVCQQEGSLLAVCAGEQCAAYRCWELAEYLQGGHVVRTRGVSRPPLPPPAPSPQTRTEVGTPWSGPQGMPQPIRPVLTIPWNGAAPALLPPEVEDHRRIHRGARGGPWNEAWRRFQRANNDATKLEIELHAGKLIYEFNLYGVVVPYSRQLLRLPSNLLEPD